MPYRPSPFAPPTRLSLHGDANDNRADEFFCARCEGFHAASHFADSFHERVQKAQLTRSLDSWMRKTADPGPRFRRPEGDPNLFGELLAALSRRPSAPRWSR